MSVTYALVFVGKADAFQSGAPSEPCLHILEAMWKWMEVVNTLAYYDTATITTVKSFIVHAAAERANDI